MFTSKGANLAPGGKYTVFLMVQKLKSILQVHAFRKGTNSTAQSCLNPPYTSVSTVLEPILLHVFWFKRSIREYTMVI